MKPREQVRRIDWAHTRIGRIADIDKIDHPAPVEPPHHRNLALAERASAIVPDGELGCGMEHMLG